MVHPIPIARHRLLFAIRIQALVPGAHDVALKTFLEGLLVAPRAVEFGDRLQSPLPRIREVRIEPGEAELD